MLRRGWPLLIALVLLATAGPARAETVKVTTAVILRERASDRAPAVARVPAGARVKVLSRRLRGGWVEVKIGARHGWAQATFFRLPASMRLEAESEAPAEANADASPAKSLAPPIVHPTPAASPKGQSSHPNDWVTRSTWTSHGSDAPRQPEPPPAPTPPASETPSAEAAATLVARPPAPERRTAAALVANFGVAMISRRFVSNGTGPMAAYELSSTAIATGASGSYLRRLGHAVLGFDLAYLYAAGGSVAYHSSSGVEHKLGLQEHDAEAGLRAGLHSSAAGGLDLWLRAGALLNVVIFDPDPTVRLQSDRLLAPTAGLGLSARHVATVGGRWLGVDLFGRAVLYGQLTENVAEGEPLGTWGGRFGGDLSLELLRESSRGQLLLTAAYSYDFTLSRWTGRSTRDPTATHSALGSAQHLAVASLGYAY